MAVRLFEDIGPMMLLKRDGAVMAAPVVWRESYKKAGWTPKGFFRSIDEQRAAKAKLFPPQRQKFNFVLLGHRIYGMQIGLEDAGWEGDLANVYLAVGMALKTGDDHGVEDILYNRPAGQQWLAAVDRVTQEARNNIFRTPVFMLRGVRQKAWVKVHDWASSVIAEARNYQRPEIVEYYTTKSGKVVGVDPDDPEVLKPDWQCVSIVRFDSEGEVQGCRCVGNPQQCPHYLKQHCSVSTIH